MARKTKAFELSESDKSSLTDLLRKGVHSSRKLRRCQILLHFDDGKSGPEVAELVKASQATVYKVRDRYEAEGLDSAINEKPRAGRPNLFDGKSRASITALACSEAPQGHERWTLRLLADRAVDLELVESISHQQIKNILKKHS